MIKTLLKSVRQYKKPSILTPLFVMTEVSFEVMIPFIMAFLIDRGIDAGDMGVIYKLGGLLLAVAFLSLFFGVLSGRMSAIASAGFARNIRQDMFFNVQKFSFSMIDRFSTSSLITRLTTDVTNIQHAYQMTIRMAARSPIMLVMTLIAAFSIDRRLSLIFLSVMPILAIGMFLIVKNAHPIFRKVFKVYDSMNNAVQENLHGMRVVKAFVREDFERKKFEDISKDIFEKFSRAEKYIAYIMPLIQFCMFASMLLLSWFGARAIVASGNNPAEGLTTGQLMSLMTYVMQILMSLMMLAIVFVIMTISRASMERVAEVLDAQTDMVNSEDSVDSIKDGSVEFENVCFSYSKTADKNALEGINLRIKSGQTIGIIGGTGSSKSSLVQLIPRLYDVTQGVVKVGGIDVRNYDIKALRDQVALVLQKNLLFSGTIKENLKWGNAHADDEEIIQMAKIAQAHDFIMKFPDGYDSHIERGGTNVSGGQRQRLSIARALLKKPKIIILDDSTSAVDMSTEASIQKAFDEALPDTTKIIIAQRITSVQDADQILVMDDGKIVASGKHESLLHDSPIYKEVYESQMKGGAIHG